MILSCLSYIKVYLKNKQNPKSEKEKKERKKDADRTIMKLISYYSVTGLDLWGVLVATGVVCIIYCTLVGTI